MTDTGLGQLNPSEPGPPEHHPLAAVAALPPQATVSAPVLGGGNGPTPPTTATPAADLEPRQPPAWRSKIVKLCGAVAGILTFVIGIISIWPILFSDSSGTQSLDTTLKPYRAETVSHYALPLTAPVDTFPVGGPVCTSEQQEWLATYGVRFQRDYLVEVRNTASSGSSIALTNFHGAGDSSDTSGSAVIVECDVTGEAGVVTEPARLVLSSGEGAFFDKTIHGATGQGQPNAPLAYNLRPGETGQIVLSIMSAKDFTGALAVAAAVGGDQVDVNIEGSTGTLLQIPGAMSPRTILVTVQDGGLKCNVFANVSAQIQDCTVEALFQTGQ